MSEKEEEKEEKEEEKEEDGYDDEEQNVKNDAAEADSIVQQILAKATKQQVVGFVSVFGLLLLLPIAFGVFFSLEGLARVVSGEEDSIAALNAALDAMD